jgi:hypothetical protein
MSDMGNTMVNTTGGVTINDGPILPGRLEVEQDVITYASATATKPDPQWEFIDPAGHFHAYDTDGELPTLVTRDRHVDCGLSHADDDLYGDGQHDCEGYDVREYFCQICDEQIKPERLSDAGQKSMPGRKSWSVYVVSDRRIEGVVSVRFEMASKIYFGVAHAIMEQAESGPGGGIRVTTRLSGAGPLGIR